jgi:hypothetical protein
MTTRRDLIKLASALGLAGTMPPTAERIAALSLLDQTASARVALDPGKFADQMYGVLPGNGTADFDHDWYGAIAPEAHAAYRQAEQRLDDFFSKLGLRSFDLVGDTTPLSSISSRRCIRPACATALPMSTCAAQ